MKHIYILVFALLLWGCKSANYQIEEIEEIVEEPKTSSNDSAVTSAENKNEIIEDLQQNRENENKFTDKQIISRVYAIQIGAFKDEKNASVFTRNAENKLKSEIYYKNIDGLYKVRVGNINGKEEAGTLLKSIMEAGYPDSFLVELTYVINNDK
ncbi:MAG TPA: SPOR domain-containing protein [Ignavibacteria bacterium]